MIPNDLPPWHTIYQQSVRWIEAECFIALVHDLREMLRVAHGRNPQPTAAIFDGRTLQSTPESGARAGYDGAKRRKGSKVPIKAAKSLLPWTRWGICWPCMSHRATSRNALRSPNSRLRSPNSRLR